MPDGSSQPTRSGLFEPATTPPSDESPTGWLASFAAALNTDALYPQGVAWNFAIITTHTMTSALEQSISNVC